MTSESNENDVTIGSTWKKCSKRLLLWISWYCDGDGPALYSTIKNKLVKYSGLVIMVVGLICLFLSIPFGENISPIYSYCGLNTEHSICIDFSRYFGALTFLIGVTLYVLGSHNNIVSLKTAAFNEEIDNLVQEADERLGYQNVPHSLKNSIEKEITSLKILKEMPSEVSALKLITLRKFYIETIAEFEVLKAHSISDLGDYKNYVGDENYEYQCFKREFNNLYREYDKQFNTSSAPEY